MTQPLGSTGCPHNRQRAIALAFLGFVLTTVGSGCMHRRMAIRSNPPGALAIVDGKEIGYTPTAADFSHYGTREIKLVKPGFETLTALQKVQAPWYQRIPLDFFSDNLLPFRVTNRHDFTFNLRPSVVVSEQELLDRANALRTESQVGP